MQLSWKVDRHQKVFLSFPLVFLHTEMLTHHLGERDKAGILLLVNIRNKMKSV